MLSDRALAAFRSALGADRVFDDAATRTLYGSDETPRHVEPDAVLFPASHDDVAALARVAFEHRIALIPRGAGSGNVGGALPAPGSVVVSFECMRRVLEFDPANRLIVVEPGVVGTLWKWSAPARASSSTKSVNVPPMSKATRIMGQAGPG